MKRMVCLMVVVCFFTVGCMGQAPYLTDTHKYGDEKLTCSQKKFQVQTIDSSCKQLKQDHQTKIAANTVLFIGGLFFWPLWLGIDAKSDQNAEIRSLQERRTALYNLYQMDNCFAETGPIDAFGPVVMAKASKKEEHKPEGSNRGHAEED